MAFSVAFTTPHARMSTHVYPQVVPQAINKPQIIILRYIIHPENGLQPTAREINEQLVFEVILGLRRSSSVHTMVDKEPLPPAIYISKIVPSQVLGSKIGICPPFQLDCTFAIDE